MATQAAENKKAAPGKHARVLLHGAAISMVADLKRK
jgi:hypothetical protein